MEIMPTLLSALDATLFVAVAGLSEVLKRLLAPCFKNPQMKDRVMLVLPLFLGVALALPGAAGMGEALRQGLAAGAGASWLFNLYKKGIRRYENDVEKTLEKHSDCACGRGGASLDFVADAEEGPKDSRSEKTKARADKTPDGTGRKAAGQSRETGKDQSTDFKEKP